MQKVRNTTSFELEIRCKTSIEEVVEFLILTAITTTWCVSKFLGNEIDRIGNLNGIVIICPVAFCRFCNFVAFANPLW